MKKRLMIAFLSLAMLFALIPVAEVTSHAAKEGMWTTYRFANNYCPPDCDCGGTDIYPPEVGYEYTNEGFTVIPAEWRTTAAHMAVVTHETQEIKWGVYLQFRVDDFSYGGDIGADHWMVLSLSTQEKFQPGSTAYGGGWMALLRGDGDGEALAIPHLTDPKTESFGGSFIPLGGGKEIAVPRDNQGREIYTLEITWDGSAYEMKVNGVVMGGTDDTTKLLEKLSARGEFYLGVGMMSAEKAGTAALTILKYGTCEADATVPVGDDSKEPQSEDECGYGYPKPHDPHSVPLNQPAILWSPETYTIKTETDFLSINSDNTWHVKNTEEFAFFPWTPKPSWNYDAQDFPVFGILLRNFGVYDGTLWYAAGDYLGPTDGLTVPFSVYDGEFYGENGEYVFVPVDLTGLWEGRINTVRLDVIIVDQSAREFDICFAGMFRSTDEAYAYAEAYLGIDDGVRETWIEETEPYEPETHYHETTGEPTESEAMIELPFDPDVETLPDGWETLLPDGWETISKEEASELVSEVISEVESLSEAEEDGAVDREQAVDDILAKYGCAGTLGGGGLLLLAAAVAVAFKRKDE